jgi:dephospho-CoA kinase
VKISNSILLTAVVCVIMEHDACSEEDLQLQRLMERNSMSEAKAKKRIGAQMSLERKCEQAHFVVENSSTTQDTREQVHYLLFHMLIICSTLHPVLLR